MDPKPALVLIVLTLVAGVVGRVAGFVPLGLVAGLLGFAVLPGLGLGRILFPRDTAAGALTRALFLSPLVSGSLVVTGLLAGFSAETVSVGTWVASLGIGAAGLAGIGKSRGADRPAPIPTWNRSLLILLALMALLVLLPHALREWVRYRSDAWFHTAVVLEMNARGAPPGDPYFAGLALHYLWFYHALVLVWSRFAATTPWNVGGLLNAAWLVSLAGGVFALSRRCGRSSGEAFFAALFVPLGLGAMFWVWFPLKLVRSLVGDTAGWPEVQRVFSLRPFDFDQVWHFTSSWGSAPPFLNKYLVMSAFGGAVTSLVWLTEGVMARVGGAVQGRSAHGLAVRASSAAAGADVEGAAGLRNAVWIAVAMFGCWILHPAVGLAALLACGLTALVLWIRPGGVPRMRVTTGALAGLAGLAVAYPLLRQSVGQAESVFPLGFRLADERALVAGSLAALILGAPMLFRVRRRPGGRAFVLFGVSLMVAAMAVNLPEPNTIDKMSFVFYLPVAVAAGWGLGLWWRRWVRRGRRPAAVVLLVALLAPVNALMLGVYFFQVPDRAPAEHAELYAEMARVLPGDAVVLDTPERDDVLVLVPRRQYWGREPYALQWGYDVTLMDARRQARDALVGQAAGAPADADLEIALDALEEFATRGVGPVVVLWRDADHPDVARADSRLARLTHGEAPRFREVFTRVNAVVYEFLPREDPS